MPCFSRQTYDANYNSIVRYFLNLVRVTVPKPEIVVTHPLQNNSRLVLLFAIRKIALLPYPGGNGRKCKDNGNCETID